jgi:hypothetical protein
MIPTYATNKSASAADNELIQVHNIQELEHLKKGTTDKGIALLFWADWH